MKPTMCLALLAITPLAWADPCTDVNLSAAAVSNGVKDSPQYACKSGPSNIVAQQATVGVYQEDGKFVCELTASTPIRVENLKAMSVTACNSGLGLLAIKVGERSLWVDRNDVTLNTDSNVVSCTVQGPSKSTPTPKTSVGVGQQCST